MAVAFKLLLAVLALLLVALLTVPWWLGAALGTVAPKYGVTFERYERIGQTRFALRGVTVERPGFRLTTEQLQADSPLWWLARRARANSSVQDWTLTLIAQPQHREEPATETLSVPALHDQVKATLAQLQTWLPAASATNGRIVRGDLTLAIESAEWSDGALRAQGTLPSGESFTLQAGRDGEAFTATTTVPAFTASAQVAWTREKLSATGRWWDQPFTLNATFPERGWLPHAAEVRADNWDVAADRLKLGAGYGRVQGSAWLDWRDGIFNLTARGEARPTAGTEAPPLNFALEARGDRERFAVSRFELRAPFAHAQLSSPLELSFDGQMLSGPAQLTVQADLAQQSWIDATGALAGRVQFAEAGSNSRGEFDLQLNGVRVRKFTAQTAHLRGRWLWPQVEVTEFDVQTGEGGRARGRGALDWSKRELSAVTLNADLGADLFARWLPAGLGWQRAVVELTAEGPLEALRHRGTLQAGGVKVNSLRPLDLAARWEGQDRALESFTLNASAGDSQLAIEGRVDERRAEILQLNFSAGGEEVWRLAAPATLTWAPELRLGELRLTGTDTHLVAAGHRTESDMQFSVDAKNVRSEWAADWLEAELPPVRLTSLVARGLTRDAVLEFDFTGEGAVEWRGETVQILVAAQGDKEGVRLSRLAVGGAARVLTEAAGRFPVVFDARRNFQARVDEDAPLELQADIAGDSPLWAALAAQSGLAIDGATAHATLTGTARAPRGELRIDAARIESTGENAPRKFPTLTDLVVRARAARDGITVESLTVRAEGHPLTASARLPMTDDTWRALVRSPASFDWEKIDARIDATEIALHQLADRFPALPFTQGRLAAHIELKQGQLNGGVQLTGGATRPLAGLGVMESIVADLVLHGRTLEVRQFRAQLGGEPLDLAGRVTLPDGRVLELDLRLTGKNVPMVRRPGALVRTDLDVRMKTESDGRTKISGQIDLTDSLVMADLADILPGGPRGAERTPPYFSVATEPFAGWPLDISVRGNRALRVRTAVFNGVATPRFQLTGTLGDPRLIGQLSVDEGRVLFPFATFTVQQGTVRISAANPHQLQLNVNAATRRHGYELRMEAGGTLQAPTVTLSSNPPLEAADVLLMVTTGQGPADGTGTMSTQQRLTRLGTFIGRGLFQNFAGGDEEKLEITTGGDVSREGRETYQIEYKLDRRWSVTGEYDEYDNYNAGVKWRVYSQEGSPREPR